MAGSVNKVTLVGNLGRDPEVRYTQGNQKIVNLSVATSERWKDRQSGEQRERTEWHRVVIFNENLAEVAEKYLAKGRTVYLEGSLQTRKWTDQQGQERYTTEVVLTRFKGELVLLGGRGEDMAERSTLGSDDGYRGDDMPYGGAGVNTAGMGAGMGAGTGAGSGGANVRSFPPRSGGGVGGGSGGGGGGSGGKPAGPPPAREPRRGSVGDDLDDDIPF